MEFKDLKFTENALGGFGSSTEINGYILSVQCGFFLYCTPKFNLSSVEDYSAFEVGIFDSKRNWATKEFIEVDDDVAGWQSRDDINKIIKKIENKTIK